MFQEFLTFLFTFISTCSGMVVKNVFWKSLMFTYLSSTLWNSCFIDNTLFKYSFFIYFYRKTLSNCLFTSNFLTRKLCKTANNLHGGFKSFKLSIIRSSHCESFSKKASCKKFLWYITVVYYWSEVWIILLK